MTSYRRKKTVFAVSLMLILMAAWLWTWPQAARAAPNVTFRTLNGQSVELESLRGKPVLINFWATSCAICMEEMPHLIELYNALSPEGLQMYAVAMSYDPPNQVLNLSEAVKLPFEVSLDLDSAIATAFGDVSLTPTTFLVDPNGNIVMHKLGVLDMSSLHKHIYSYL